MSPSSPPKATMPTLTWKQAVLNVLESAEEPMHYTDIAQAIIDQGLRRPTATPARTVASELGKLGNEVTRLDRGNYFLTRRLDELDDEYVLSSTSPNEDASFIDDAEAEQTGIINTFGMYWRREEVDWAANSPRLYGTQLSGGEKVDFAGQIGIYILYQGERTVYVGRAAKKSLADRLRAHTRDRLTARWDRFSWFGLRPVSDSGNLGDFTADNVDADHIAETMEAIFIEGLEPPQNRRRGDKIENSKFIQVTDPEIQRTREQALATKLLRRL
ncbi:HTH domain-containing protein [Corynebacterium camporealensis]